MQEAEDIYEEGVDKLEEGKYIPALNKFREAFEVVLNAYVCDANIDVYSWMPDGYVEDIWSGEIEQLEAESYEVLTFDWHPTKRGIHYLRFNMTGEYEVYKSPVETVEAAPTIMSFGIAVVPHEGIGIVRWKGGHVIPDGVTEIYESVHILMTEGDLIIESGGQLIFEDEVTFVIVNPDDAGEYGINITAGGKFVINSPLRDTTIKSSWKTDRRSYFFHNHGTVDFTGADVMYTYGDPDITEPGGIQNFAGSVCILDNTNVLEADTHSVYIASDTEAHIRGTETVIGRLDGYNEDIATGHGIWVQNGVTPVIQGVTIQFNQENGVFLDKSTPSFIPVEAENLQYYASENYDRSLIQTSTSISQPLIVAGNGNLYAVYLDEVGYSIYFMRSNDQGRTWTDPLVVPGSGIEEGEGYIGNIDFAADGDNLTVAWEVWTEDDDWMWADTYVQYSYTGGGVDNWADEPYVIDYSRYPSVDVEGDEIYVAFLLRPDPLGVPRAIRIRWTGNGWDEGEEHDFDLWTGIPKVAVVGDTVHIVIASEGNIYYTRSDDGGETWTELEVITGYTTKAGEDYRYGYISLEATEERAYLVWSAYDAENECYEVYGKYAAYEEEYLPSDEVRWYEWVWYEDILISFEAIGDSLYPSIAADVSENWYVVWQEEIADVSKVRYSRLGREGEIEVSDMVLTPDTTQAILPSISIDSDGYAYLVWIDEIDGIYDISLKQVVGLVLSNNIISNRLDGIRVGIGSDDNKIIDNTIQWNDDRGIRNHGNSNTISNNIVNYNQGGGIYTTRNNRDSVNYNNLVTNNMLSGNSYYSILFWNSDDNVAYGNHIYSSDWGGIQVRDSDSNYIYENTIYSGDAQGIGLWGLEYSPENNVVTGNYLMNNYFGIYIVAVSHSIVIEYNHLHGNIIGIGVTRSSYNIIKNNRLHENVAGIYVTRSNYIRLETNLLSYNEIGIILSTWAKNIDVISNNIYHSEYGVYLYDRSDSYIVDNDISNNLYGIYANYSDPNIIENNIIKQNWEGIFIENSISNEIKSNFICDNYGGIIIYQSMENTIGDNHIFDNQKEGVWLLYSDDNSIQGNNIYENEYGIRLTRGKGNTLENNIISTNTRGIYVFDSHDNYICHNQIISNTIQASDYGDNYWNLPYPYGGNYWSDHTEPDYYSGLGQNIIRSDGIVDHPRSIHGGDNQDSYPVTDPERFYVNVDYIVIIDEDGNEIPAENHVDYHYTITGYAAAYDDDDYGFIGYPSVSWSVENIGASASTSPTYGPYSTFNAGDTLGAACWYADYKEISIEMRFEIGFEM